MTKNTNIIIKLRNEKNLSQQEVADKLKISRNSYIAVEKGKKELSLSEAEKLANILGINILDIVSNTKEQHEKYKEMLLLFLRFSKGDGKVPKTKLAKLLYLADFSWFYENLKSMSGCKYKKLNYGPVPDTYFRALSELEEEGKINIDRAKNDIFLIGESDSSKAHKLKELSKEEKAHIKKIANKWENKRTAEIVNFTHKQLPYSLSFDGEIIPYDYIIQEDPKHVY